MVGVIDPPSVLTIKKGGALSLSFFRFSGSGDEVVVGKFWFEISKLGGQNFLEANEIGSALSQIRLDRIFAMHPGVFSIGRVVVSNVE